MDSLAVTAITDFILACEALFFAGMLAQRPKQRGSAAWYWNGVLITLGLAGLVAGIDHGFVEPAGLSRLPVQRLSWWLLGAMTLSMVLTLAAQFFSGRVARGIAIAGVLQFVAYVLAVPGFDSYFVVIVDYAPVLLGFLLMNLWGLRRGTGSWPMVLGLVTLALASVLQASGRDGPGWLDHNVLYHLVAMPGLVLLHLGGRRLKVTL